MRSVAAKSLLLGVIAVSGAQAVEASDSTHPALRGSHAWRDSAERAIRGMTVGPIESAQHAGRGYGTDICGVAMADASAFGANWVSITPFGRVYDLQPSGVALSFEAPYGENQLAVAKAIQQAHDAGLKVMLVPHLWVETGEWRGFIDPGDDAAWEAWAAGYFDFVARWARLAQKTHVEMLVVGVELRSWVTTQRAQSFSEIIARLRRIYSGLLTYAANWDDVFDTVIWGDLDLIGVNAFFPLAKQENATDPELFGESQRVAGELAELSALWQRPVVFTEFGYTTRRDPALEPWLWPEHLKGVAPDELAQASAYRALLGALIDEPWFVGGFVWRVFSDPYDFSQEPEWGFSPRWKLAELVLEDAYRAHWASDGPRHVGSALGSWSATRQHLIGIEALGRATR